VLQNKVAGDHPLIFLDILNLYVDVVKDFTDNRGPELKGNDDLANKLEFAEICVSQPLSLNELISVRFKIHPHISGLLVVVGESVNKWWQPMLADLSCIATLSFSS